MEEAEVERRRQVGMPHEALAVQHRVLPAPEVGQPALDEALERAAGLIVRGGPQPRTVLAEGGQPHAIEVTPHPLVDVALAWPVRARRAPVARGWLAVLGVEVPASAGWLVAFHEQVEAAALLAVEVLHHESLASVSPGAELVRVSEEQRALHQLDAVELDSSRPPALEGRGAERCRGGRAARVDATPRGGSGPHVVHLDALFLQLGREVAHGRQHQVELCRCHGAERAWPRTRS